MTDRRGVRGGKTFVDVLVGILVILLVAGAAVPAGIFGARERANRVKCASNLRQIGQGMLLYSNDNKVYPRVKYDAESGKVTAYTGVEAGDPFGERGPEANDVSAALYLLVRNADINPEVFLCPSMGGERRRGRFGGRAFHAQQFSNFPDGGHLNYSVSNPYPSKASVAKGYRYSPNTPADWALAGDMNSGAKELVGLKATSPAEAMRAGNSLNHDREGQNVLFNDGHVEWTAHPFVGGERDNIYTYGLSGEQSGGDGVIGFPVGPMDTVLLPTANEGKPATRPTTKPAAELPRTPVAWDLDQALTQVKMHPGDAYAQYVALQLAYRDGTVDAVAEEIDRARGSNRFGSGREVDLLSLFGGALAVQESLQLDAMRGEDPGRVREDEGAVGEIHEDVAPPPAPAQPKPAEDAGAMVPLDRLKGPTVKSHPWEKMLAGRKVELSRLSNAVPEEFYLIEFRSVGKLLEVNETADLWASHLAGQAFGEAKSQEVGARLRKQLAVRADPLSRPFYDQVVSGVAIAGSDPFVREGSDVTLLFHVKQPLLFKARMDGFLDEAGGKREEGVVHDVPFVHVSSGADRAVHVYSAYPSPEIHVRSNSKAALERVIGVIRGKEKALAGSAEFQYIRTLMPSAAQEEDGLVYLSDAFIRRLVGPRLKLTERRRLLCHNHLKMIGHASLMYRTEYGKVAPTLGELTRGGCTPGTFGEGTLACPDGGKYDLSGDKACGTCSVHGHAHAMTPNLELPLSQVTEKEARQYEAFLRSYNEYWRTYFDPIAIRLRSTDKQLRVETIILPLIDNSVYTMLAQGLGGTPEHLDAMPVPPRNIFTAAVRLNKELLLEQFDEKGMDPDLLEDAPFDEQALKSARAFLEKGIGSQVALNVYDAPQTFDFSLPRFMGMMMGQGGGGGGDLEEAAGMWGAAALVSSLNAPVYLSVPVKDRKVVDEFLATLDRFVAQGVRMQVQESMFFTMKQEFYRIEEGAAEGEGTRCYALQFGPVKLRLFWARVGDGLYVASKPFILEDLRKVQKREDANVADATGHAMLRMRAENWRQVLADYRLGWAEHNREACLDNLGLFAGAIRADAAMADAKERDAAARVMSLAERHHQVRLYCPEGGEYQVLADRKAMVCPVHGTAEKPRQAATPAEAGPSGELLRRFGGLTATLTFTEEGLRAVVIIDRR